MMSVPQAGINETVRINQMTRQQVYFEIILSEKQWVLKLMTGITKDWG